VRKLDLWDDKKGLYQLRRHKDEEGNSTGIRLTRDGINVASKATGISRRISHADKQLGACGHKLSGWHKQLLELLTGLMVHCPPQIGGI
jgi:hypothetical protein